MLAIRLQRTGRKGLAQYRVVVQDSRRAPTSERVVARLGHYDPHSKTLVVDSEKAETYLKNGAQPSDRVARLFKANKITLPSWVQVAEPIERSIRNPEKLRKNRPAEPETPVSESPTDSDAESSDTDTADEVPATDETPQEVATAPDEAKSTPEETTKSKDPASEEMHPKEEAKTA